MAEMQSVDGAPILVRWMASYSESASRRPIRDADARGLSLASAQIRRATELLTRENEVLRNCDRVVALVSLSIVTSWPSSMP